MVNLSLAEVKIFYDKHGQAREVLMDYETFQQIRVLLQELIREDNQSYFWTESWQNRIREAEADIQAGHTKEVPAENLESLIEWLDE